MKSNSTQDCDTRAIPPIDVETAIDLVLALPAHRSSDEGHARFGAVLVDEYIVKLREHYRDDPTAFAYLNELMAVVGSAVRAFSVTRDIFTRQRSALVAVRQLRIEDAEHIREYSPLHKDGVWGRVLVLATNLGGTGVLSYLGQQLIGELSVWVWIAVFLVLLVPALLLVDFLVQRRVSAILSQATKSLPEEVDEVWHQKTKEQYCQILSCFLRHAIRIQRKWYPKADVPCDPTSGAFEEDVRRIAKQHLAV